jgi:transcriptional regulator with XRE-family HTH domain
MPRPTATSSTIAVNGYALRWGRKLMNLTPGALAESIGKDRTYIVKIETGAVTRVSTDMFQLLVEALKLEDRRALMAAPHEDAA